MANKSIPAEVTNFKVSLPSKYICLLEKSISLIQIKWLLEFYWRVKKTLFLYFKKALNNKKWLFNFFCFVLTSFCYFYCLKIIQFKCLDMKWIIQMNIK